MPCCEPVVINTCSGRQRNPNPASWPAMAARSSGSPSVVPYWLSSGGKSPKFSSGMASRAGRPPAKEMMSGFWVRANSSRIRELVKRSMRSENMRGVSG